MYKPTRIERGVNEREKRLPKWVQEELISLRRELQNKDYVIAAYTKQQTKSMQSNPPIFYARYIESMEPATRPIDNAGLLWIETRLQQATYQVSAVTTGRGERALCVRSTAKGQLVVLPQVCNTAHIQSKR